MKLLLNQSRALFSRDYNIWLFFVQFLTNSGVWLVYNWRIFFGSLFLVWMHFKKSDLAKRTWFVILVFYFSIRIQLKKKYWLKHFLVIANWFYFIFNLDKLSKFFESSSLGAEAIIFEIDSRWMMIGSENNDYIRYSRRFCKEVTNIVRLLHVDLLNLTNLHQQRSVDN